MRERYYDDPEVFDMMVDAYVEDCASRMEPVTLPDLSLYLGFSGKGTLYAYGDRPEFEESVKRAKAIVEAACVRLSMSGGAGGGPIFLLKNMGYSDKREHEFTPINIKIEGTDAKL